MGRSDERMSRGEISYLASGAALGGRMLHRARRREKLLLPRTASRCSVTESGASHMSQCVDNVSPSANSVSSANFISSNTKENLGKLGERESILEDNSNRTHNLLPATSQCIDDTPIKKERMPEVSQVIEIDDNEDRKRLDYDSNKFHAPRAKHCDSSESFASKNLSQNSRDDSHIVDNHGPTYSQEIDYANLSQSEIEALALEVNKSSYRYSGLSGFSVGLESANWRNASCRNGETERRRKHHQPMVDSSMWETGQLQQYPLSAQYMVSSGRLHGQFYAIVKST